MNRAVHGARSLHRTLFIWLLLPQVVLWVAAALFTYNLVGRYAHQAIDASLAQASRALARQIKPTATGLFIDLPRSAQEILEADPSDRVLYAVSSPPGRFLLGDPLLPAARIAAPRMEEPYFFDAQYVAGAAAAPERVRVVALYLPFGAEGTSNGTMLVQVARSRASSEALARSILVDTALPLSVLIALMTVIVWAGIRAGLRPLKHLQLQVEGRAANDLAPIGLDAAPLEVRALAGAINTLLERERQHVTAQKRFISDAAHQLRTPLAGLKSQTEIALHDAREPLLVERLQRVHASAQRSARLVNQLLALARAEPDSAAASARSRVDLAALASAVAAQIVPRALAAGADLGFAGPDDGAPQPPPLPVDGVPLLLGEALTNLIDNAIHYAGSGASITVRARRDGAHAVLEVEDDGPGLPAADRERVFERFVRGREDGTGCGLGLAIVREIAQRHGGSVSLLAAEPRGLIARMVLPAAMAAAGSAAGLATSSAAASTTPPTAPSSAPPAPPAAMPGMSEPAAH
ncbi:MAG: sensor histidine kinase [Proteobacteria bacterium]|nr:sensor histidine kinase [Pseudomonadota bacterium]